MANRSARSPAAAAKRGIEEERVELDDETIRDLDEGFRELESGAPTTDAKDIIARWKKQKRKR